MRFVIAVVLVVLAGIVTIANGHGFKSIENLIGYVIGGVIIGPSLIAALFCIPKSGRNNKQFFRAYNVVLLLVLLAGLGQFANTNGKPQQTITDEKRLTEITVPGTWQSDKNLPDNVLYKLTDKYGSLMVIVGYVDISDSSLDLEQYAKLLSSRFEGKPNFKSKSEIQPCENMKYSCVYQLLDMTNDEVNMQMVLATVKGNGKYYNYVATTSLRLYENNKEQIFRVLGSLHEI